MNDLLKELRENREEIVAEANRWINLPVVPERVEGILLGLLFDAVMLAIERVLGSDEARPAGS